MALTSPERTLIRELISRRHPIGAVVKADLLAAVGATDDWIEANQAAFNTALPEPFKSTATTGEKTLLFCYVAAKRAGLLPDGGI